MNPSLLIGLMIVAQGLEYHGPVNTWRQPVDRKEYANNKRKRKLRDKSRKRNR